MDNLEFGSFIAQLRKEQNLTQKELADRLHVTDKAVSKWETGKGFPDLKLMEPLAQALGISLVELIQCQRQQTATITMEEAECVVAQAMDQSRNNTARRYLKLFRWVLTGIAALCFFNLVPYGFLAATNLYHALFLLSHDIGVIGGADGPTAILTASAPPPQWLLIAAPLLMLALFIICIFLAIRIRSLEKKLK